MKNKFIINSAKLLSDISIKYKFYFLFVFVTIFMGSLMILSNYISTKAIIKKAYNQSYREAVLMAELLNGYFDDAVSYAKLLAIDEKFQENLTAFTTDISVVNRTKVKANVVQIVNTYMIARPIFSDITITDHEFSSIYQGYITNPMPKDVVGTISQDNDVVPVLPQFTKLMKLSLKSGEQPGIALVKSVIEKENGNRIGVIILYMTEDDISEIYSTEGNYNGEVTLVDKWGNVLSSSQKENLNGLPLVEKSESFNADGSYFTSDNDGRKVIVSISTMKGTGWKVINKVLLSDVTKELAATKNSFLIITLAGIIIASLSGYRISTLIIKPILNLSKAMNIFRLNQSLDLHVETASDDEIGNLGKIFNNMMEQIKALITEKDIQQRFIREYEVRLLQAQINPHFLYNSLETIIMLEQLDMKEQSIDAAKKLASFYRLTLSQGKDYITVRDEINLTSSYLSIQKYRYIEYLDYNIEIQPDIMDYIMPKLTIQPILENAIYHGLKPNNGGHIKLKGYSDDGDLIFTVRDDGMGMTQEKINQLLGSEDVRSVVGSFGMPSVNTKLKLLYGPDYGIGIVSEKGEYTLVTIRIPKRLK